MGGAEAKSIVFLIYGYRILLAGIHHKGDGK